MGRRTIKDRRRALQALGGGVISLRQLRSADYVARRRALVSASDGPSPPVMVTPPQITSELPGIYRVGVQITATPPTFTPEYVTVAGEWYVNGVATGDTDANYTPVVADVDDTLYKQFVGTDPLTGLTTTVYTAVVGPVEAEVPTPAPLVADQTLTFGRLTLAGAGEAAPTNTGGDITSAAITGGTNASHWQISAAGTITPSATGVAAGLSASYTLTCSFTNDNGSDTATITINTEANTYSVATTAEMQTVQELAVATLSGKTIKMRAGDYRWPHTVGWFKNKSYTSTVTLTSHDNANRARIFINRLVTGEIMYLDDPTNLTFYRVDLWAPWEYDQPTAQASGGALNIRGTVDGLKFIECDIGANWKELVDTYGFDVLYSGGKISTSWCWRGIITNVSATNVTANGLEFRDCTIHGSSRLLNVAGPNVSLIGNEFYDFSGDGFNISQGCNDAHIAWNTIHSPLSLSSDINHRDGYQFLPGARVTGVRVYCNRTYSGRSDAYKDVVGIAKDTQCHFMEDVTPYNYVGAWVFLNFGVSEVNHGISLYNAEASRICGNLMLLNPSWASDTPSYPTVFVREQGTPAVTPFGDIMADNFAYVVGYAATTVTWGVAMNNVEAVNPQTSYGTYFDGPSFTDNDTIAEAMVAFSAKAGGPLMTANPRIGPVGTGYVDWTNRVWDYPRMNTLNAYTFTDVTGATASTLYTASPAQITGIVDSDGAASSFGAWVWLVGGTAPEFRITLDEAGSTVVTDWTATPLGAGGAMIQNGQWLWVRDTSSGSAATTTTTTVYVGGRDDAWSITTA